MASLSVNQYLQALAPAVAGDPSAEVYIEMAEERTNRQFYGEKSNQAVALMAAHLAFLFTAAAGSLGAGSGSAEGGTTGTITSKREGDLAVTYGGGASSSVIKNTSDADLAQTRFGLQLLALRKGCKPFIGVVGGCCRGCEY